jgi:hypothetical protein
MKKIVSLVLLTALFSGCSITAPNYSPSVKSVQSVKASNATPVAVAKATAAKADVNKVSLRGNPLNSPYGTYAGYIEAALKKELSDAGLLDEKSSVVINTTLTKNNIDTAMSKGTGDIAAIFSVTKAGKKVFEKEISAHDEWDSSFVGAIAIPNAVNAYPGLVNKLVTNLFNDKEFINAIAK